MKIIKPKGILVALGGGNTDAELFARITKETGKSKVKVCYMTVAISSFEEAESLHKSFSEDLGIDNLTTIHFDSHSEADTPENIKKIKGCDILYIGGGNQSRLSSMLGGTRLLTEITIRYYDDNDFLIVGNSAGSAAMSDTMIVSGSSQDGLIKGELKLTNGLDLIHNVCIDTHFTERGRFGRLIQTVTYNPGVLGLGLSINTGAIIYKGEKVTIIGNGLAVIVDGTAIQYSNLTEIAEGRPITVAGLRLHVLGAGSCFTISDRTVHKLKYC